MRKVDLAFQGWREAQDGSVPGLASKRLFQAIKCLFNQVNNPTSNANLAPGRPLTHWVVSLHAFAQLHLPFTAVMLTFVQPKLEIPEAISSC